MTCQVANPAVALPCGARESGGYRCERTDPHDDSGHWVSEHTIDHARAGNGYACAAIPLRPVHAPPAQAGEPQQGPHR